MSENKERMKAASDENAPDLSAPYWVEKLAKSMVQRGLPKADVTKVSMTIRLDQDVIEAFKAQGAGWQSRMNDALRKAAGL